MPSRPVPAFWPAPGVIGEPKFRSTRWFAVAPVKFSAMGAVTFRVSRAPLVLYVSEPLPTSVGVPAVPPVMSPPSTVAL